MIFAVIVYLFCTVGGLTLVKLGSDANKLAIASNFFNLQLSYLTVLGLVLYIVSFVMWIVIVQQFDLSYIQPVTTGLSYVLIIAASIFILKETVTPMQWAGLGFILVGVILMNLKK